MPAITGSRYAKGRGHGPLLRSCRETGTISYLCGLCALCGLFSLFPNQFYLIGLIGLTGLAGLAGLAGLTGPAGLAGCLRQERALPAIEIAAMPKVAGMARSYDPAWKTGTISYPDGLCASVVYFHFFRINSI